MGKSMFSSTLYVWLDPSCMIFRYLDVNIYIYISLCVFMCCISICSRYAYMFTYISHLYVYISVVSICLVPLMPEVPKKSIYMLYIFRYVKRFFLHPEFPAVFQSPPLNRCRISSIKKCTSLLPMNFECGVPLLRSTMNRALLW